MTTEMEEKMDKENTNVDEQQKMLTIMSELVEKGRLVQPVCQNQRY